MEYRKYPRTLHHPLSECVNNNDKVISWEALRSLMGTEVVITEKMDGENTTIYPNGYTHARSIDSKYHESRTWVKSLASTIAYNIPEGHRLCGENMYAEHSIHYDDLLSYFLLFSVWDDEGALSWSDTESLAADLGLQTVTVLFQGVLTEEKLKLIWDSIDKESVEGIVVRDVKAIPYDQFENKVFKLVRPNHVQTDEHWMKKEVVKNDLRK